MGVGIAGRGDNEIELLPVTQEWPLVRLHRDGGRTGGIGRRDRIPTRLFVAYLDLSGGDGIGRIVHYLHRDGRVVIIGRLPRSATRDGQVRPAACDSVA